jgi:hypothetical protein
LTRKTKCSPFLQARRRNQINIKHGIFKWGLFAWGNIKAQKKAFINPKGSSKTSLASPGRQVGVHEAKETRRPWVGRKAIPVR